MDTLETHPVEHEPITIGAIEREVMSITGTSRRGAVTSASADVYRQARENLQNKQLQKFDQAHRARFDQYYEHVYMKLAQESAMLELMSNPDRKPNEEVDLEKLIDENPDLFIKHNQSYRESGAGIPRDTYMNRIDTSVISEELDTFQQYREELKQSNPERFPMKDLSPQAYMDQPTIENTSSQYSTYMLAYEQRSQQHAQLAAQLMNQPTSQMRMSPPRERKTRTPSTVSIIDTDQPNNINIVDVV